MHVLIGSCMNKLWRDASLSAATAGLIAVMVSYAGPLVVVFQAAKAGGIEGAHLSSWIWAISIGSGITCIALSLRYRVPVITAWSTPGAALLVAGLPGVTLPEAIGAFVFSSLLITLSGCTGVFSALMRRIPQPIVAAMLAGILLRFGLGVFTSLEQLPQVVLPMILGYLIARRTMPRYAVIVTLLLGFTIAFGLGRVMVEELHAKLVEPVFVAPAFSPGALIGMGVPLFFVTMASQNAPGVGVLRTSGFNPPINPLITVTGLASLLLAPFGAHGINLAAITAAICTGPEAHANPDKRYVAGVVCGLFYILIGTFGATIATVFSALPSPLIATVAGLALFASLTGGLTGAMAEERDRESALVTFLVTASGLTIVGVGAAFWGLLAGLLTSLVLTGNPAGFFRRVWLESQRG